MKLILFFPALGARKTLKSIFWSPILATPKIKQSVVLYNANPLILGLTFNYSYT
jgi:hypothetical protein